MKKFTSFLLAIFLVFTICAFCVSAEEIQPRWDNTGSVVLGHTRIGTTAHVNIDLTVDDGSTVKNAVVRLISMDNPSTIVKTWSNPQWTINAAGVYNFYDTHSPVQTGKYYRLTFQCEVWRNGVKDQISLYKDVQY